MGSDCVPIKQYHFPLQPRAHQMFSLETTFFRVCGRPKPINSSKLNCMTTRQLIQYVLTSHETGRRMVHADNVHGLAPVVELVTLSAVRRVPTCSY